MTEQERQAKIYELESTADEIRGEAGRYGDQCEFTQKQLRSIRKAIEALQIGL